MKRLLTVVVSNVAQKCIYWGLFSAAAYPTFGAAVRICGSRYMLDRVKIYYSVCVFMC